MENPRIITNIAPNFIILCDDFLLIYELNAPIPNINGTVPKLNKNIERAPFVTLPVERA
ncbi:hypothetical protein SDC9_138525 [bioreactor metagenome]|uniref:Uncharacterized protein n=1 Tax=bioreactor metagenome TaxID=1076179 RepID=A0A645DQ05_9ZZZZ